MGLLAIAELLAGLYFVTKLLVDFGIICIVCLFS